MNYNELIAFNRLDKVCIKELERNGTVIAIVINDYGVKYDVRYFDNGKVQEVYFYEDDLELLKPESQ